MRTSLTRLRAIEQFLSGNISTENRMVFEAHLLLDNELATDVKSQEESYNIIKFHGRQTLKAELEILHQKLAGDPKNKMFWRHIQSIFQRN